MDYLGINLKYFDPTFKYMKVIRNIDMRKTGFSAELAVAYSMGSMSIPDVIRTLWYRVVDLEKYNTDPPIVTSGLYSILPVNLKNDPKIV